VTPETVSAFSTVTAGIVMLSLATRKRMIELRGTKTRCPSCGRLYRRGDVCRCVGR
jgi:hypothetical protein